jgi:hypothetical protein
MMAALRFRPVRWVACVVLVSGAVSSAAWAQDLTGTWCDDWGTRYIVRQAGSDVCWRMDSLPRVQNVFCGSVIGSLVVGSWLDLPGGQLLGSGKLILSIDTQDRMTKSYQEGNYGGSVWTRNCAGGGMPTTDDRPLPSGASTGGARPGAPPPPPPGTSAPRSYPPPPPPPTMTGSPSSPRSNAPPPPPPPSSTYPSPPRSNAPAPPPYSSAPPRATAPATPAIGGSVSLPPRPGSWRLVSLEQRGAYDDRPQTPGDGGMRFDVRRFDSTGGEVLVTVTIASPAMCPQPESESVLVKWSFPGDIRYLQPGQEFAVDMSVEPFSQSRLCPTAVFGRSEAVVMRSEGSIEDFSPSERPAYWPVFTHPYVKDPTGVRLNFYVGGAPTGRAVLHVNDERPPMNARRGSYSIRFWSNACCGTPQPAVNSWAFHYVYEY